MSYTNYNQKFRRNKFSEPAQLISTSNLFTPTADQKHMLGCRFDMNDGRSFRYCKAVSDIDRALMACGLPPDSESEEIPQTAQATDVGEIKFDVLMTTSNGITNSSLIDGYLWVNKSPTDSSTIGDFYIIKDNKWTTEDTVLNITIADEGGIRQAISATDEISIIRNRFRDVKLNPTSQDAAVVGVPLVDIDASETPYFWAQYRGVCPLMVDASDTVVIGQPIGKAGSAGTPGGGGVVTNDGTDAVWGTVVSAGAADEISLVDLMIP